MISKEDVARFAIDAGVGLATGFIFRTLAGKSEVHRDALPGDGSGSSGMVARGTFLKFSW